jgi:uncharacterized membrane protein YeaQ/YmgE (transglycosylase-associated protein family)
MEPWLVRLIGYALYVLIGFISTVFIYHILKKSVLGKFWAAFVMGIIGSVLGGFLLDDFFRRLTDVFKINVLSSLFLSCLFIWFYSTIAPGGGNK